MDAKMTPKMDQKASLGHTQGRIGSFLGSLLTDVFWTGKTSTKNQQKTPRPARVRPTGCPDPAIGVPAFRSCPGPARSFIPDLLHFNFWTLGICWGANLGQEAKDPKLKCKRSRMNRLPNNLRIQPSCRPPTTSRIQLSRGRRKSLRMQPSCGRLRGSRILPRGAKDAAVPRAAKELENPALPLATQELEDPAPTLARAAQALDPALLRAAKVLVDPALPQAAQDAGFWGLRSP